MGIRPRGGIVAIATMAIAMFAGAGSVAAASATLRIDPGTQTVAQGATFTVKVIQNAAIPTAGTQASVTFDQTKVQIQSVTRAGTFADAPYSNPADMNAAIAGANSSGKLKQIATAFFPPDTVAAGDQVFLVIVFTATGCGNVQFGLPAGKVDIDAQIINGTEAHWGDGVPITTSGGSVTIDCSGTAPTLGASATDTPAPGATSGPTSASKTAGPAGDTSQPSAGAPTAAASSSTETVAGATSSSGSDGGFLLWLPVLLSVPAVAIVALGLLRSRRPMTS